jgi:predicted peptidase
MRKILIASLLGAGGLVAAETEALEWKAADGTLVRYRWAAPEKIEEGKRYPLVLFLHGAGERGNDNKAQLMHGVTSILEGAEKLGTPCFMIAPQCPAGLWWAPIDHPKMRLSAADKPNALLDAVMALVDEKIAKHPIDPKRFHVTGLSMGGFGTWDLLGRAPEKIASAIPICGGGDPERVANFKDVPIWAFHGAADEVVPARCTREMIEALEKAGGKPKSTIYPKTGHDSWTRTYKDPEVLRWFFSASKP